MLRALVLGAAAAALALPARADTVEDDLRCIIVVGFAASQKGATAQVRDGLMTGLGYYIGRLKGRDPAIDLSAKMSDMMRDLKLTDLQADFPRCGEEMKVIGAETERLGKALEAIGKATGG